MEAVPVALLNGIGVVGTVLLVGWFLWTGRLVTRREVERVEHDRDEWRAESRIKDSQVAEKDEQLRHVVEVGLTMKAVLEALQRLAHDGGNDR